MSQEALSVYRQQRAYQVSQGPMSEEFTIVGGTTFRGVFDRSMVYLNKDSGEVEQQVLKARIIVPEIPASLLGQEQTARVTREGDTTNYLVYSFAYDDEGIPVIWLM
jgi:hypothetical protein